MEGRGGGSSSNVHNQDMIYIRGLPELITKDELSKFFSSIGRIKVLVLWIPHTPSRYTSEECVLIDFFLDDGHTCYLTQMSGPSLNAVELLVIHCMQTKFKVFSSVFGMMIILVSNFRCSDPCHETPCHERVPRVFMKTRT